MAKNKIEFTVDEVSYTVTKPNNKDILEAGIKHSTTYTQLLRAGSLATAEVEKIARERNLWDDFKSQEKKRLNKEYVDNERIIAGRVPEVTIEDKRKAALKMFSIKRELQNLDSAMGNLFSNTAEFKAREAKMNVLIVRCTKFTETGKNVWKSVDELLESSENNKVADEAMVALAIMEEGYDPKEYEKFPEYKFLLKNKMCDEQGRLINADGELVDTDGNRINDKGQLINDKGEPINEYGDPVDEDGFIIPL